MTTRPIPTLLDMFGPAYVWIKGTPSEQVTEAQFRAAMLNYIEHTIATFPPGVQPPSFYDPDEYFKPGDLQHYENIKSVWSNPTGDLSCPVFPGLESMVQGVRMGSNAALGTFRGLLDHWYKQFRAWCDKRNIDPDNPHESSVEKNRRMSRERMRRKRARDAANDTSDPGEMELVETLRKARENLRAGQAWFKGVEAQAKAVYDAAIEAAKLARLHTVSEQRVHVTAAENAVTAAQAALDQYRINK